MFDRYKLVEWIHPDKIIMDGKYFSFNYKHVGFCNDEYIINYNHFYNKCNYDIKIKNVNLKINNVDYKPTRKFIKVFKYETVIFPFLLPIKEPIMNCKIQFQIYMNNINKHLADAYFEVDYNSIIKDYEIIEVHIEELL